MESQNKLRLQTGNLKTDEGVSNSVKAPSLKTYIYFVVDI
jgi:hypothetical protein